MNISEVIWHLEHIYGVVSEEYRKSLDEAIEAVKEIGYIKSSSSYNELMALRKYKEDHSWIPITTRPCTDEELEEFKTEFGDNVRREDFPFFTCPMPDDGQEILTCTGSGYIFQDTAGYDEYGLGLENNGDWDGIVAWMPMPEPYKGEKSDED